MKWLQIFEEINFFDGYELIVRNLQGSSAMYYFQQTIISSWQNLELFEQQRLRKKKQASSIYGNKP